MLTFLLAAAFVAAWAALYLLLIRPKLAAYRTTAGIAQRLESFEAGLPARLALLTKGAKVALIGFVTSAAPVLAVFYDKAAGLDWAQILPGEQARLVALALSVCGIVGPMVMVALHGGALAEAAALEPRKEA